MIEIQSCGLVGYREAHQQQLELVERLQNNQDEHDTCLVLEHPPVFTLGRNGSASHIGVGEDFLTRKNIEVVRVERGGEVTYHGPGQLVCYPVVNLKRRGLSVIEFVALLESIMRSVVSEFGIEAVADSRNRGLWVGANKIGSIGIAVKRGVAFHGLALNVNLDLTPFSWINPCGLKGVAMTSMARELSGEIDIKRVRQVLLQTIEQAFQEESSPPKRGFVGQHQAKASAPVHQPKPEVAEEAFADRTRIRAGQASGGHHQSPYGLQRSPLSQSVRVLWQRYGDLYDHGGPLYQKLSVLCGAARPIGRPRPG